LERGNVALGKKAERRQDSQASIDHASQDQHPTQAEMQPAEHSVTPTHTFVADVVNKPKQRLESEQRRHDDDAEDLMALIQGTVLAAGQTERQGDSESGNDCNSGYELPDRVGPKPCEARLEAQEDHADGIHEHKGYAEEHRVGY